MLKYVFLAAYFVFSSHTVLAASTQSNWTFIFYVDALDICVATSLPKALAACSIPTNMNVLVQIDNVKLREITRHIVTSESVTTLTVHHYASSASPREAKIISEFCCWAATNYPAQHYGLCFSGHGFGLSDEKFSYGDDQYVLQKKFLEPSIAELTNKLGKKLDFIAFDACLMGDVGTMEFCKDHADFLISSEDTMAGTGFPFRAIFTNISGSITTTQLVDRMVRHFGNYYSYLDMDGDTLSAMDLSYADELLDWLDDFGLLMIIATKDKRLETLISKVRNKCNSLGNKYVDLSQLLRELNAELEAARLLEHVYVHSLDYILKVYTCRGMYLIDKLIYSSWATSKTTFSHGLSIFFPKKKPKIFNFDRMNSWHRFLNIYYEKIEPAQQKSPEISLRALII